jgi:hypothetical protein
MTNTATSRDSYHKLNPNQIPSEAERCLQVFQGRPELPFSHRDVACATGLAVNVAQSRCSHLFNHGEIIFAGVYLDLSTRRSVQKYILAKHKNKPLQHNAKEATT